MMDNQEQDLEKYYNGLKEKFEEGMKKLVKHSGEFHLTKEELESVRNNMMKLSYERNYYGNILKDKCGYASTCSGYPFECGCSPSAKTQQGFSVEVYKSLLEEKINMVLE